MPQALACPGCGSPVTAGQKFCAECGTPQNGTGQTVIPATVAPVKAGRPERRLVTVLFADLVAYTTLSEHRDPELIREMLELYFERCRIIVGRYGGVIEKFIGDAVMAVWGTPVAHEDDAERAVRAALELTAAVTALGEELAMPELRVRAGLLTGETAVNVGAEHEGMVIGDAVNTASRIQSLAEPETVFVDDATRRATEKSIAYEDAGTHSVKGRAQPVRVHKALRVVAGAGGARRGSGLEAPFVGRDHELRAIVDAAQAVIVEGRARSVTVLGEAGMGKSRLGWEFLKHVDGIAEDVFWHQGRCLSYGEGVSFWALAEIVRARAEIAENDPVATAREKLGRLVETFVADEREQRLVLPRLEHLLGLAERSGELGDLFSGWRLFFERLAEVHPVALVFEDLQWADHGLLDFIDHLLEWSGESAIFVLALARPEVLERRPAWRADAHVLRPLTDADMHALLGGLVPGLPEEAVDRISARADGIPLYAVETVRMLLDRGLLRQDGAVYAVSGDVDDVQVPETLHALVASRLDGLTPDERRLTQDASVLGMTFPAEGLAELSGLPLRETTALLDGLVAKQVFGVELDPRSPERGNYGFLQALLKTVAYGTLGRRDRKARHLAAAAFLERSHGGAADDHAEVLATHYTEAVRADPDAPDAPALRAKAMETLAEAGRRALSFGLGSEARGWFELAADLATEPHRQAELLDQAGRASILADEDVAVEVLERAAGLFEAAGDARAAIISRARRTELAFMRGDTAGAVSELRAALDALGGAEVDDDQAFIAALLARCELIAGIAEEGLEHIDIALRHAERAGDLHLIADALVTRGSLLDISARPQEGIGLLRHALTLAQANGETRVVLRAHNNLANILGRTGRHIEALVHLDEATELAERQGDRGFLGLLAGERLKQLVPLGRWDEAVAIPTGGRDWVYEEILRILVPVFLGRGEHDRVAEAAASASVDIDDPEVMADVVMATAAAQRDGGDAAAGLATAEGFLDTTLSLSLPLSLFYELLECAAEAGETERGEAAVSKVLGLGAIYASPLLHGRIAAFRGRAALQRGDAAAAEAELERAVGLLREAAVPFELARALLDLGVIRGAPDALDEARRIFTELGAEPWLARVPAEAVAV